MLGAIIGDIAGSTREIHNIKTENFNMIPEGSRFTDDSVMTLAVAEWLITDPSHNKGTLISCMQWLGKKYINAGYGHNFKKWLMSSRPLPYNSYGNGSAMRVSPVGLYAATLEETMNLARITAEVSHNHPEGIKGAQAVAACVFMNKHGYSKAQIKKFVEENFGYNLDVRLEDIRTFYEFDVSCQGSVPIAIMAFLQRDNAEDILRLAISMGGDSDTIGCMAASIATACSFNNVTKEKSFSRDIVDKCRYILPDDLLDICKRFEEYVTKPLHQSFHVSDNIFAGEYPGDKSTMVAKEKIKRMTDFGIRNFIDLTEEGELEPYAHLLPEGTSYYRFPIPDCSIPSSINSVHMLIDKIEELNKGEGYTYVHCWGGVGRTGTITACYLARQMKDCTIEMVLHSLRKLFSDMPKSAYRTTPDTMGQVEFITKFTDSCKTYDKSLRMRDCIRGCMIAGAAGDALGYPVEFMSGNAILNRYGKDGIREFELSNNRKAEISDDTQMSLFTANGLLMGITRGSMRGIMGPLESYVKLAYIDWYYTQTGKETDEKYNTFTWLKYIKDMYSRRAPGCTCMSACENMLNHQEVTNDSKGCGGIMRVAPLALVYATLKARGSNYPKGEEIALTGAEIARLTHKHPLAFLPSAMLVHLISNVIATDRANARDTIIDNARDAIKVMKNMYPGEFENDKIFLERLTEQAIEMALNNRQDRDNIMSIGEGWTGEEAWAISLYCAIRHADSVEDAIAAAVNHDGDSDSTGAITGNIMGAIYGYEHMRERNIFCHEEMRLEDTLELSDIILAISDDIFNACPISEYSEMNTPEKIQWYDRYCVMKPTGINHEIIQKRK